ncbi:MAG: tRNA pseudouridine(38-40) synthase TruA [Planctomycetota bacterium]|nr:MAG: tRNA pseudouridine(38-40) synthase TruA [Planctomycetota bacterium]
MRGPWRAGKGPARLWGVRRSELGMGPTRNLRLIIEYVGASFAGWQVQPHARTVMGEVERAIEEIARERVRLVAASRTDAGVHALGQVASFVSTSTLPTERLRSGLNAVLPAEVVVRSVQEVPAEFHARFSARGKHYRYRILNQQVRSPLEAGRAWHVPTRLDVDAMNRAAHSLEGERAFTALATQVPADDDCVRRLHRVRVRRHEDPATAAHIVSVDVVGDSFLYKMVRTLVGTLCLVGKGKRPPEWVAELLTAGQRAQAGPTAPAHGLHLMHVFYDGDEPSLPRYLERMAREGNHHRPQHAGPRQRQGLRGAETPETGALL